MGIRRNKIRRMLRFTMDLNVMALDYILSAKILRGKSQTLNRRFRERVRIVDKRIRRMMFYENA